MRCPQCHCLEDKVVDSRATKENVGVRRRRECMNCGHRFTTYEEIIHAELKVVKKSGVREDFHREKLRSGIEKACWKRKVKDEDIDRIVEKVKVSIESDFDSEVSSIEIGNRVIEEIKIIDEVAYVRYASVYRQFRDIDEFIKEIKTLGHNR